jgi:hypothetical protein
MHLYVIITERLHLAFFFLDPTGGLRIPEQILLVTAGEFRSPAASRREVWHLDDSFQLVQD